MSDTPFNHGGGDTSDTSYDEPDADAPTEDEPAEGDAEGSEDVETDETEEEAPVDPAQSDVMLAAGTVNEVPTLTPTLGDMPEVNLP